MKKYFKSIALLLVAIMAIILFSGCSSKVEEDHPIESGEKVKIGVACNNFNDLWMTYLIDAIKEQSELYPDYDFIYSDAKEDVATQISQVEDFINNGVSGIILLAVNTDACGPITTACNEAKIPIISVARLLANQEDATCYIGSESIEAGRMQGEAVLKDLMNGQGRVAILMGPASNETSIMRTEGVKEVAKKYPGIEIVAVEIANWMRDEAITVTENWIQSGLEFDAILSNNDEMAIGAVLALEAAGKKEGVLIAGIDATPEALDFMKSGRIDITLLHDAATQGKTAADSIVKAIQNTLEEDYIWIPFQLVTPDRADEFIDLQS
ncbi:MAG: sugar ABC transporter substrate-binding protein [Saccharofermentanales bacterium]|jgi:inositol transport system substrate-binding protein